MKWKFKHGWAPVEKQPGGDCKEVQNDMKLFFNGAG